MRKFGSLLIVMGLLLAGTVQAKPMPLAPKAPKETKLPTPVTEPAQDGIKGEIKDLTKYKLGFLQALVSEPLPFALEACSKLKGKMKMAEMTDDGEVWLDCDKRFAVLANKDEEVQVAVIVASKGVTLPQLLKVLGPPSKSEDFEGKHVTSWRGGNLVITHVSEPKGQPSIFIMKVPAETVDSDPKVPKNYNTL